MPTTIELVYNYYNDTLLSVFDPEGIGTAVVEKLEDLRLEVVVVAIWHGNGQDEKR